MTYHGVEMIYKVLRSVSIEIRAIFLRDQECFGEAYIMFTGTADLVGWERSGDRLIKYVTAFSECRLYGTCGAGASQIQ